MSRFERQQTNFAFSFDGKEYLYCYIRKNACSSWKRFISRESPYVSSLQDFDTPMKFLGSYHKIHDVEKAKLIPNRIVIVRDPYERVVSGFINQYVRKLESPGVLHSKVSSKVGGDFKEVSFFDFVERYLMDTDDLDLDVHFIPQDKHINRKVKYNKIWNINKLCREAEKEFGVTIAERYFHKKVNSSPYCNSGGDMSIITAAELFEHWKVRGRVPGKELLLDDKLFRRISDRYSGDVKLVSQYP